MRFSTRKTWFLLIIAASAGAATWQQLFPHQLAEETHGLVSADLTISRPGGREAPDFAAMEAGKERKAAFFAYLRPLIDAENDRVAKERRMLLTIAERTPALRWLDRYRLRTLRKKYLRDAGSLDTQQVIDELLLRVDVIPVSLALAQAAKESAWGTARFAVKGNNYFGQRCWQRGCGIVPKARAPGRRHEVATYSSVQASVASYLLNLNTHEDYAALRTYRAELRAAGEPLRGIPLAERITQYSERREAYVDEIQSLIHFNQLEQYP